ncbi:MAG: acylphosphatase [Bacteroidota bacterium]|nr:acylphosphatase [Candidatus Kapabacteria bacterium]MCS7302704.1 acylphosphatase [Candidatus Kapabacteria bacterium]MCX7937079.1 acylphosphatase [Chlorobiota bacterium]MDW8075178.1 acylphosphatase [Bacteroidota bacterium]MDW8272409.1 acylphosphatase [Bacteroidota bacterium]
MDEHTRAYIVVRGRVQGVGYRMFVYRVAIELGLVGYVRNASDGQTVIAEVEGPRGAVEQLVARCWQGPPRAYVEDVSVTWSTPQGQWKDFRIAP